MAPHERIQTVVFLRHGVAQHNVLDPRTNQRPDLHDPFFFDPPLLTRGKVDSVNAGEAILTWWHTTQTGDSVELVVTSPLTRCLQTAVLAFLPGSNGYEQQVPIACIENAREAFGMHFPDRRREKTVLQKHWPIVKFDPQMPDSDEWWKPDKRENWADINARVHKFLQWLVRRQEDNIVVVSHGVWIESCLQLGCPGVLEGRRVYNGDAFACDTVSRDGSFVRFQHVRQIYGAQPPR